MNRKPFLKRVIAIALVSAMAIMCTLSVCADSTTTDSGTGTVSGSVGINGSIVPLMISVTHQITLSYTIDPNSGTFSSAPIAITNNTKVPISVSVQSLGSASGGTLTFQDVMPNAENWSTLNESDSQTYIALGVKIADPTGWNAGYNATTDWAAVKTPITFGSINPNQTASLQLVADNGIAFTGSFTANANIVLVVSLV